MDEAVAKHKDWERVLQCNPLPDASLLALPKPAPVATSTAAPSGSLSLSLSQSMGAAMLTAALGTLNAGGQNSIPPVSPNPLGMTSGGATGSIPTTTTHMFATTAGPTGDIKLPPSFGAQSALTSSAFAVTSLSTIPSGVSIGGAVAVASTAVSAASSIMPPTLHAGTGYGYGSPERTTASHNLSMSGQFTLPDLKSPPQSSVQGGVGIGVGLGPSIPNSNVLQSVPVAVPTSTAAAWAGLQSQALATLHDLQYRTFFHYSAMKQKADIESAISRLARKEEDKNLRLDERVLLEENRQKLHEW